MTLEEQRALCAKDKGSLKMEMHPALGEECLAVRNPFGNIRWVYALRFLRVGETKVGVIARYRDEVNAECSYISFWDGRDGIFIHGKVRNESYYVPWMECFALYIQRKGNKREYVCIAANKRDAWIAEAIRALNDDESANAKVEFNPDYGFYIRPKGTEDELPIDKISVNHTAVTFHCGESAYSTELSKNARNVYDLPNRVQHKYNQQEVLAI